MNLERNNWDVVVVGHWNRAILTPSWIAKKLFQLPEGTGIEVAVPIDVFSTPVVKWDGLSVMAEEHRLTISSREPSYEQLAKAMKAATIALEELPKTPLFAAGFNIRFKASGVCEDLCDTIQCPADETLSDAGYEIVSKGLKRSIHATATALSAGVINLSITEDDDKLCAVDLNFHRDSKEKADLQEWLGVSPGSIESEVSAILAGIGVTPSKEEANV